MSLLIQELFQSALKRYISPLSASIDVSVVEKDFTPYSAVNKNSGGVTAKATKRLTKGWERVARYAHNAAFTRLDAMVAWRIAHCGRRIPTSLAFKAKVMCIKDSGSVAMAANLRSSEDSSGWSGHMGAGYAVEKTWIESTARKKTAIQQAAVANMALFG